MPIALRAQEVTLGSLAYSPSNLMESHIQAAQLQAAQQNRGVPPGSMTMAFTLAIMESGDTVLMLASSPQLLHHLPPPPPQPKARDT